MIFIFFTYITFFIPFSFSLHNINSKLTTTTSSSTTLPLYYNIGDLQNFEKLKLNKIVFNNKPYCVYFNDEKWHIIDDICIHRGASLSKNNYIKKSNFNNMKCIICPYHGWEYNNDKINHIPGIVNDNIRCYIPYYSSFVLDNYLYVLFNNSLKQRQNIFIDMESFQKNEPLEKYKNDFVSVQDYKNINAPSEIVVENILDMMHVSYVHYFGNKLNPVPFNITYTNINPLHGKTTYMYNSGINSISHKYAKSNIVVVENEFILPTTTITRVIANQFTKTIVTHTKPIDNHSCVLYYKLYRNYFTNIFGDFFHKYLMDITLQEDIHIINSIYTEHYQGKISTKYDITQTQRRKKILNLMQNK